MATSQIEETGVEDETAGGQQPPETQPPVTKPATETPDVGNAPETGPDKATAPRANDRIRQLVDAQKAERTAREAAEAESARLQTELEAAQSKAPAKTATETKHYLAGHPALKGQTPDGDGEVQIDGVWVKADYLANQYDIAHVREMIEGDQKTRKQAELDAREGQHRQELAEAVEAGITEMRDSVLPGLAGEHGDLVDRWVLKIVEAPINEAYHAGKFTPEFADETIKKAFGEARAMFAVFGTKQFQDNLKYAEQNKVGKVKTPGAPAEKTIHEMTARELEAESSEWARKAEEMSRRRT